MTVTAVERVGRWLDKAGACSPALTWLDYATLGKRNLSRASLWKRCPYPEWLAWVLLRADGTGQPLQSIRRGLLCVAIVQVEEHVLRVLPMVPDELDDATVLRKWIREVTHRALALATATKPQDATTIIGVTTLVMSHSERFHRALREAGSFPIPLLNYVQAVRGCFPSIEGVVRVTPRKGREGPPIVRSYMTPMEGLLSALSQACPASSKIADAVRKRFPKPPRLASKVWQAKSDHRGEL